MLQIELVRNLDSQIEKNGTTYFKLGLIAGQILEDLQNNIEETEIRKKYNITSNMYHLIQEQFNNYKLEMPLLESIYYRFEEKYKQQTPNIKKEIVVYQRFETYGLTPREEEIGYLWLQNKSALYIAETLGITEGTVRTVIKNVYRKTQVNDKGQYYQKFLA
jgi:DNA-binding CsgD family transcriptional regulator